MLLELWGKAKAGTTLRKIDFIHFNLIHFRKRKKNSLLISLILLFIKTNITKKDLWLAKRTQQNEF